MKLKIVQALALSISSIILLSSCSKNVQKKLGIIEQLPDEYQVEKATALEIPPHYQELLNERFAKNISDLKTDGASEVVELSEPKNLELEVVQEINKLDVVASHEEQEIKKPAKKKHKKIKKLVKSQNQNVDSAASLDVKKEAVATKDAQAVTDSVVDALSDVKPDVKSIEASSPISTQELQATPGPVVEQPVENTNSTDASSGDIVNTNK